MRGKVICIEGNDRVGKHTQAVLLADYVAKKGYNTKCISFPNYGTEQAKPVESYLAGNFPTLGPIETSMLYAFDRVVTFEEQKLKDFVNDGGILIIDRYTPSNIIFQTARAFEEQETIDITSSKVFEIVMKIERMEYDLLDLPRPDLIVYLNLNDENRKKLLEKESKEENLKGVGKIDFHENNIELLNRVSSIGLQLATLCSWTIIECFDHDTLDILSKEKISEKIISALAKS